ncbi:MAG TPA: hypothetical protein VFQ44_13945 [Streptosporangiaceae bacterium]|nr:hypothetical protein [Streptosporangiaceae bacterium]
MRVSITGRSVRSDGEGGEQARRYHEGESPLRLLGGLQTPEIARTAIEGLDLGDYHLYHATRADLLTRLDRRAEAVLAYDTALAVAANPAERGFLEQRKRAVASAAT